MKVLLILAASLIAISTLGQTQPKRAKIIPTTSGISSIPPNATTIIVTGVSFIQVCNALLENGYNIEKKDNDFQTVQTELKHTWRMHVRVKDSAAFITGTATSLPYYENEPVSKGGGKDSYTDRWIFDMMNDFAKSLGGNQINYK